VQHVCVNQSGRTCVSREAAAKESPARQCLCEN